MLRISNLESITDTKNMQETIPKLVKKITPILEKRKKLHKVYTRNANDSKAMYSDNKENTVVTYEKFLTDIAAGYLSGTPTYTVDSVMEEEKRDLLKSLFDKEIPDKEYADKMKLIIDYITGYNDDETEHHDFIHDILEMTAAYEILYENEFNEIVYSKYSPLNTVAIWDFNIPANLIALVRVWDETDINDKRIKKCEITDKYGTKTYSMTDQYKEVEENDNQNHNWGDVPAIAVENDFAIFEPCEDIISAFEQLIQNVRNTFQYNDTDCKLKFSGYIPENPLVIEKNIEKDDGTITTEIVENEARKIEDEALMKSKTLYVQEGGDASWIKKELDCNGATEILKVYTNLMFQLAGIPNTSDLAFNSADLNASAIDRKFYIMNMMTANVMSQVKKAYQRKWELIFGRINLKSDTKFDFRDVNIELPKNLPANDDERIDSLMKLQTILSEQTILEKLGYNYLDEKEKKDKESEDNMTSNIERMKKLQKSGAFSDDTTIQEQTGKKEINTQKSDDEIIKELDKKEQDAKNEKNASKK